jgi:hypothetical protein
MAKAKRPKEKVYEVGTHVAVTRTRTSGDLIESKGYNNFGEKRWVVEYSLYIGGPKTRRVLSEMEFV